MRPPDPPRIPRLLLALLLRGEEREFITGDLEEEYWSLAERIGQQQAAAKWYRRQALQAVAGRTALRLRRTAARLVRRGRGKQGAGRGLRPEGRGFGRRGGVMGGLWQDVRFGLRSLVRRPGFTAVAAVTLALGVGANAAMFGVLDSVLLRPLTYPDADRIVQVWSGRVVSKSTLVRIDETVASFEAVTGYESTALALTGVGTAEEIDGAAVSPSHFDVVGVRPAVGRGFVEGEATPGADAVVVLSHALWIDRFGADLRILGRSVILDGRPRTVVGVMPAGYRPVVRGWRIWVPLTIDPSNFSDYEGTAGTRVLARLGPGATPRQAEWELEPLARSLHNEEPAVFDEEFVAQARAVPMLDATVRSTRTTLWLLLGAVGMVLLIACANVANLLLAQGTGRGREMAVRRALGGSRRRLVRQLLVESTLLGIGGGMLGIGVAAALLTGLGAHLASGVPRGDTIALDLRLFTFALALSLGTTLLFGLFPAIKVARPDLRPGLSDGGRRGGAARGSHGMNRVLMAAEVAISVVLLFGAGLLLKSSWLLQRVDPGFPTADLLTLRLALPADQYPDSATRVTYIHAVEEQVRALAGVTGVGSVGFLPMTARHISTVYTVDGRPIRETAQRPYALAQVTTSGALETLGIPMIRGRWFDDTDRPETELSGVINEALAAEAFGSGNPLGRTMQMFGTIDFTVIGVVGDVRQTELDREPRPETYFSYRQFPAFTDLYLTVRTSGDPMDLAPAVQERVRSVDVDVAISRVAAMDDVVRSTTSDSRLTTLLFSLFAGLALLLGVVGVYGVISYTVSARTYEIGVRMAMGAPQTTIVREVVGRALVPVLGGLTVGLLAALASSHLLRGLLFQVRPWDPIVLGAAALTLGGAALLASFSPVRRAASIDPASCLNTE